MDKKSSKVQAVGLPIVPKNTSEEDLAEAQDQVEQDVQQAFEQSHKTVDLMDDYEEAREGFDKAIIYAQSLWLASRKAGQDELSGKTGQLASSISKQAEETYRTMLGIEDQLLMLEDMLKKFSDLISEDQQFMQRIHSQGPQIGERVLAVFRRKHFKVAIPITVGAIRKTGASAFTKQYAEAGENWFKQLVDNLMMAGEKNLADQVKQSLDPSEGAPIVPEAGKVSGKNLRYIPLEMERGQLSNPHELTQDDVGHMLGSDFGRVSPSDVGHNIYWRDKLIQMENDEQMNRRKNKQGESKQARPLKFIKGLMERGKLPNPYELTWSDVGHYLGADFDVVLPSDVGRQVFLNGDILQMENDEQMQKRKGV